MPDNSSIESIRKDLRMSETVSTHASWGIHIMRKLILSAILGLMLLGETGCLLPMYSGDPARRNQQLLYTSENLRQVQDEWERLWLLDQPNHMSPNRRHGGII